MLTEGGVNLITTNKNRPAFLQDQFAPAARRVPEVVRESDPKPDVTLGACPEDYSRGAQSRGDNGGDAGTSAITLATVSAVSCLASQRWCSRFGLESEC